jgi:hypothetical protein
VILGKGHQPATNTAAPESIQALRDMGAHLQTLRRYHATTEVTGKRVLIHGQKLRHLATATVDVVRPNKLRARMAGPRSERVDDLRPRQSQALGDG